MKKLSEVCRIVGVTRRTLQEYDRIGLFKHSAETQSGYWLYDDEAIWKLYIILIFVEAGYKRLKIKEILSRPQDLLNELKTAIQVLKQKRNRIDGLINTIDLIILSGTGKFEKLDQIFDGIDDSRVFQNVSFKEYIEHSINAFANGEEYNMKEWMPFYGAVFAIMILRDYGVESEKVQTAVKNLCDSLIDICRHSENGEEFNNYSYDELLIEACEGIDNLLNDPDLEDLNKTYGAGSVEFIRKAVNYYREKLMQRKEEE